MENDGWLGFVDGAFEGEWQIHPTRIVDWIRRKLPSGTWKYDGEATLLGANGKSRMVRVGIEGKSYLRHRLIALSNDGTAEGLAKFLDWKNNPVLHGKRRREDERPDDTPENVRFGTAKDNNADPNNKKRKAKASGHPVLLKGTTIETPMRFDSVLVAAAFLGTHPGNLRRYLNRNQETSGLSMPKCKLEGVWEAVYDEFELEDAVRLVRAAAELYLSPSRQNELFRKLKTGKFAMAELERRENGYVPVGVGGGNEERLHRLVVETLRPWAFDAKLAANHGLTKKSLQVDHIDGDERNNTIDNLEVLTTREHARKHALAVEWIDASGKVLEAFECAVDVVDNVPGTNGRPLHHSSVQKVCDGVLTHTGGRFFRWKDVANVRAKRAAKTVKR
jgi:hypothetical protein